MPKFKPNTSAFRMKGSPFLKDVKMYEGGGSQISVDEASLGKVYMDEYGNQTRDYSYTSPDGTKGTDVLYLSKPRFEEEREPLNPSQRPNYA